MRMSARRVLQSALFLGVACSVPNARAQMADGPDKDLFIKTCTKCHEVERALSKRQDKTGWQETVAKMQGMGLQADDADLKRIIDYLAINLPADAILKLNINTATRIDLESSLSIKRSVAAAIIDYREKNGAFQSVEDLKKVPGVDATVIDAKKSSLTI